MEDRRNKYRQKQNTDFNYTLDLKFDITELDLMCAYIVSSNRSIRRGHIVNLNNVFNHLMDISAYGNDQECLNRIEFIRRGIKARLEKNLIAGDMILRDITGGLGAGNINAFRELSNTEVEWVNNNIEEIIKDADVLHEVDRGLELLTRLKSANYIDRKNTIKEFEGWITGVQNKFRKARVENASDLTFSLMGDRFVESMLETYRDLTSPSNRLVFGTQALNLLTGGGVVAGRVYTILGLPGEGKSSTLLDMAIQIKKYNRQYKCKDPTKRPCVVLFIMENDVKETIQRLFSMCVLNRMENYNENEIINEFRTKGLRITDDDPIDLIIKFRPNLSEDTSYMYTLTEDLEDEGYEVICILQDYLKRIRSVEGSFGGDLRLQLGAVINEFKIFATIKGIPVITASQLNRSATVSIDNARVKNKSDLVRTLGRGNVGESNLILENSDWICLIAPEVDIRTGQAYLGILRVKSRYYIPDGFSCAYIPYVQNSIKFVEDYGMPLPAHKITMMPEEGTEMINGMSANIIGNTNTITNFNGVGMSLDNNVNNIFESSGATMMVAKSFSHKGYIVWPEVVNKPPRKQMYHLI